MKRFIVAGSFFLVASVPALQAQAADPTYPVDGGQTAVEFGSGWYLRGDIGWNIGGKEKEGSQFIPDVGEFLTYDYNDALSLRAGFGYQLNPSFRLELDVENLLDSEFGNTVAIGYSGSFDFDDGAGGTDTVFFDSSGTVLGTSSGNPYGGPSPGPIIASQRIDASYNSQNILVNAYFDVPMGRLTPYVGAGVGLSRVTYDERRVNTACSAPGSYTCGGSVSSSEVDYTRTLWAPAYSLSAGAAYALNDRLSLDIGYSFLSVNSGEELNYDDGTAIDFDGFTVHQVRAGLRYQLW